ncbi:MAG: hypothetical protein KF745_08260 [Phycisphaeraceae bacterium]|nr:hypothetical protein [Phycisphaeraceae bacterium]
MANEPLAHVIEQIKAAQPELESYAPVELAWYDRAMLAAKTLVPWLAKEAPSLRLYVEEVLNSPAQLRDVWAALRLQIDAPSEVARIDELLAMEGVLLDFVAGDTVSIVVTGRLRSRYPSGELVGNSKSDYPDLYIKTLDYSKLPTRTRSDKELGAAVRGKEKKPVRVPDGLEIKTSRDNANIDCHYPHVGLHLMLSFITTGDRVVVDDVLVAFLRYADYRITEPKTKATTLKASFSRAPFVSLLPTVD